MKLLCPYCSLEGEGVSTLLGKKVRCPKCQNVFRVADAVSNTPNELPTLSAERYKKEVSSLSEEELIGEPLADEDIILEHMDDTQPADQKKCEKCGFVFSHQFFVEKQGEYLCAACAERFQSVKVE